MNGLVPAHGAFDAGAITHVADDVMDVDVGELSGAQLALLQLIAAEDHNRARLALGGDEPSKGTAERAGAPGDEDHGALPAFHRKEGNAQPGCKIAACTR